MTGGALSDRWVLNLTTGLKEVPLLERPRAAAALGFRAVEFWWPFGAIAAVPAAELDAFCGAVESAGVRLAHMNLYGGDMDGGERGVVSYPERTEEFLESVEVAAAVAERLGTPIFNVPYGHRRDGLAFDDQDRIAAANLGAAADRLAALGATVLTEPVSGFERYPLLTTAQTAEAVVRAREASEHGNVAMLLDQFHLAKNGDDVLEGARRFAPLVAHVQLADLPRRDEPGRGDFPFETLFDVLDGYDGDYALEYHPTQGEPHAIDELIERLRRWQSAF